LVEYKNIFKKLYNKNNLLELEKSLNYKFRNKKILITSLIHSSFKGTCPEIDFDNERYEFLGDSVISFLISTYLFEHHKSKDEGFLSTLKSKIVSKDFLYELGKKLALEKFIFTPVIDVLIKNKSTYENTFESLMGAIYLDGGLKSTKKVFFAVSKEKLSNIDENESLFNPKSDLQEYSLKKFHSLPFYDTKDDHNNKGYVSSIYIEGKLLCWGYGKSKKEAERNAALLACKKIKIH
jgi:ribonuclease-3